MAAAPLKNDGDRHPRVVKGRPVMHRLAISITLALRNLTLHKLRVFLTIIGLIFGVASVIAMLAIAEGASLEAQRQIAELGATNIIVRSSKPPDDVNPSKQQNNDSMIFKYGITYKDFERIVATMPTVTGATPLREFRKNVRHLESRDRGPHRRRQSRLPQADQPARSPRADSSPTPTCITAPTWR